MPRWINRVLLKGQAPLMPMTVTRRHEHVQREWSWNTRKLGIRVEAVCRQCNNGWMSDLETAVGTFTAPMISEGRATVLDAHRQTMLATWATKVTMLLEVGLPSVERPHIYYSADDRRRLRTTMEPPENVVVWISKVAARGCHGQLSPLASIRDGATTILGHFATLWIGQLVIQVLAYRPGEILVGNRYRSYAGRRSWMELLLQIWPASEAALIWPTIKTLTPDELSLLTTRFIDGPPPQKGPRRAKSAPEP